MQTEKELPIQNPLNINLKTGFYLLKACKDDDSAQDFHQRVELTSFEELSNYVKQLKIFIMSLLDIYIPERSSLPPELQQEITKIFSYQDFFQAAKQLQLLNTDYQENSHLNYSEQYQKYIVIYQGAKTLNDKWNEIKSIINRFYHSDIEAESHSDLEDELLANCDSLCAAYFSRRFDLIFASFSSLTGEGLANFGENFNKFAALLVEKQDENILKSILSVVKDRQVLQALFSAFLLTEDVNFIQLVFQNNTVVNKEEACFSPDDLLRKKLCFEKESKFVSADLDKIKFELMKSQGILKHQYRWYSKNLEKFINILTDIFFTNKHRMPTDLLKKITDNINVLGMLKAALELKKIIKMELANQPPDMSFERYQELHLEAKTLYSQWRTILEITYAHFNQPFDQLSAITFNDNLPSIPVDVFKQIFSQVLKDAETEPQNITLGLGARNRAFFRNPINWQVSDEPLNNNQEAEYQHVQKYKANKYKLDTRFTGLYHIFAWSYQYIEHNDLENRMLQGTNDFIFTTTDAGGCNQFEWAVLRKRKEIVHYFIDCVKRSPQDYSWNEWDCYAASGNLEQLSQLSLNSLHVNWDRLLYLAAKNGQKRIVNYIANAKCVENCFVLNLQYNNGNDNNSNFLTEAYTSEYKTLINEFIQCYFSPLAVKQLSILSKVDECLLALSQIVIKKNDRETLEFILQHYRNHDFLQQLFQFLLSIKNTYFIEISIKTLNAIPHDTFTIVKLFLYAISAETSSLMELLLRHANRQSIALPILIRWHLEKDETYSGLKSAWVENATLENSNQNVIYFSSEEILRKKFCFDKELIFVSRLKLNAVADMEEYIDTQCSRYQAYLSNLEKFIEFSLDLFFTSGHRLPFDLLKKIDNSVSIIQLMKFAMGFKESLCFSKKIINILNESPIYQVFNKKAKYIHTHWRTILQIVYAHFGQSYDQQPSHVIFNDKLSPIPKDIFNEILNRAEVDLDSLILGLGAKNLQFFRALNHNQNDDVEYNYVQKRIIQKYKIKTRHAYDVSLFKMILLNRSTTFIATIKRKVNVLFSVRDYEGLNLYEWAVLLRRKEIIALMNNLVLNTNSTHLNWYIEECYAASGDVENLMRLDIKKIEAKKDSLFLRAVQNGQTAVIGYLLKNFKFDFRTSPLKAFLADSYNHGHRQATIDLIKLVSSTATLTVEDTFSILTSAINYFIAKSDLSLFSIILENNLRRHKFLISAFKELMTGKNSKFLECLFEILNKNTKSSFQLKLNVRAVLSALCKTPLQDLNTIAKILLDNKKYLFAENNFTKELDKHLELLSDGMDRAIKANSIACIDFIMGYLERLLQLPAYQSIGLKQAKEKIFRTTEKLNNQSFNPLLSILINNYTALGLQLLKYYPHLIELNWQGGGNILRLSSSQYCQGKLDTEFLVAILEIVKKSYYFTQRQKEDAFANIFKYAFDHSDVVMLQYLSQQDKAYHVQLTSQLTAKEKISWNALIRLKNLFQGASRTTFEPKQLPKLFLSDIVKNHETLMEDSHIEKFVQSLFNYLKQNCNVNYIRALVPAIFKQQMNYPSYQPFLREIELLNSFIELIQAKPFLVQLFIMDQPHNNNSNNNDDDNNNFNPRTWSRI